MSTYGHVFHVQRVFSRGAQTAAQLSIQECAAVVKKHERHVAPAIRDAVDTRPLTRLFPLPVAMKVAAHLCALGAPPHRAVAKLARAGHAMLAQNIATHDDVLALTRLHAAAPHAPRTAEYVAELRRWWLATMPHAAAGMDDAAAAHTAQSSPSSDDYEACNAPFPPPTGLNESWGRLEKELCLAQSTASVPTGSVGNGAAATAGLAYRLLDALCTSPAWHAGDVDWLCGVFVGCCIAEMRRGSRRRDKTARVAGELVRQCGLPSGAASRCRSGLDVALAVLIRLDMGEAAFNVTGKSLGSYTRGGGRVPSDAPRLRLGDAFLHRVYNRVGRDIREVSVPTLRWLLHRTAPIAEPGAVVRALLAPPSRSIPRGVASESAENAARDADRRVPGDAGVLHAALFKYPLELTTADPPREIARLFMTLAVVGRQVARRRAGRRRLVGTSTSHDVCIPDSIYASFETYFAWGRADGRKGTGSTARCTRLGFATQVDLCFAHLAASRSVPEGLFATVLSAVVDDGVDDVAPATLHRFLRCVYAHVKGVGNGRGRGRGEGSSTQHPSVSDASEPVELALEVTACGLLDVMEEREGVDAGAVGGASGGNHGNAAVLPTSLRVPLAAVLSDILHADPVKFGRLKDTFGAVVGALVPVRLPASARHQSSPASSSAPPQLSLQALVHCRRADAAGSTDVDVDIDVDEATREIAAGMDVPLLRGQGAARRAGGAGAPESAVDPAFAHELRDRADVIAAMSQRQAVGGAFKKRGVAAAHTASAPVLLHGDEARSTGWDEVANTTSNEAEAPPPSLRRMWYVLAAHTPVSMPVLPPRVMMTDTSRLATMDRLVRAIAAHRITVGTTASFAGGTAVSAPPEHLRAEYKQFLDAATTCYAMYAASARPLREWVYEVGSFGGGAGGTPSRGARGCSGGTAVIDPHAHSRVAIAARVSAVETSVAFLRELAFLRHRAGGHALQGVVAAVLADVADIISLWSEKGAAGACEGKGSASGTPPPHWSDVLPPPTLASLLWAIESVLSHGAVRADIRHAYTKYLVHALAHDPKYLFRFSDGTVKRVVWAVSRGQEGAFEYRRLAGALEERVLKGNLKNMSHAWFEGCKLCFERMNVAPAKLKLAYDGHFAREQVEYVAQRRRRQEERRGDGSPPRTRLDTVIAKWVGSKAIHDLGADEWFTTVSPPLSPTNTAQHPDGPGDAPAPAPRRRLRLSDTVRPRQAM